MVNPDYAKVPRAAKTEEDILGMLMLHPEMLALPVDGKPLGEADMPTDLGKRIFAYMESCGEGEFSFGGMNADFTESEMSRATYMMVKRKELVCSNDTYMEYVRALRAENAKNTVKSTRSIQDILELKRNQQ